LFYYKKNSRGPIHVTEESILVLLGKASFRCVSKLVNKVTTNGIVLYTTLYIQLEDGL